MEPELGAGGPGGGGKKEWFCFSSFHTYIKPVFILIWLFLKTSI